MKTRKITYRTKEGLIFNTIIHADNADQAVGVMVREYAFDRITILKNKPSIKKGYSKCCNHRIK